MRGVHVRLWGIDFKAQAAAQMVNACLVNIFPLVSVQEEEPSVVKLLRFVTVWLRFCIYVVSGVMVTRKFVALVI